MASWAGGATAQRVCGQVGSAAAGRGDLHVAVDQGSPVPLNHQVSSQLEAAIAAGRLPKGSYLSGEIELAARWASPGPTARRAIEEPVAADDQLAALLEVAVGAPLVHLVTVQIVMSDDHRHCFDLGRHIYDAALYTNNTRDVEP